MIQEMKIFRVRCVLCTKEKRVIVLDKTSALDLVESRGWLVPNRSKDLPIYCPECKNKIKHSKGE